MVYVSSMDKFTRELDGIYRQVQATDPTNLDVDVITECVI